MIGPESDAAIRQAQALNTQHSTVGQANPTNWLGAIANHPKRLVKIISFANSFQGASEYLFVDFS